MTVQHAGDTPVDDQADCPTCGRRWMSQCRCPCRQRTCPGGHTWISGNWAFASHGHR